MQKLQYEKYDMLSINDVYWLKDINILKNDAIIFISNIVNIIELIL